MSTKLETGEAAQLRMEYETQLQMLQERCSHKEITGWLNEFWDSDKTIARKIKACCNCHKVMSAEVLCNKCFDYYPESVVIMDKGLPVCQSCSR